MAAKVKIVKKAGSPVPVKGSEAYSTAKLMKSSKDRFLVKTAKVATAKTSKSLKGKVRSLGLLKGKIKESVDCWKSDLKEV